MPAYEIKLAAFEGPMDLLMHLIEKNKIDIYDIPIAEITEQYLGYLDQFKDFNIEIATEFLVMAATLLQIKSRILLPQSPPLEEESGAELDPRQELVERLIEYRKFKEVSTLLDQLAADQAQFFFRAPQKIAGEYPPLENLDITMLTAAFQTILEANIDQTTLVAREVFSIQDKMLDIMTLLIKHQAGIYFAHAFTRAGTRAEVIATFLAVLELLKLRRISILQTNSFSPIFIKARREQLSVL